MPLAQRFTKPSLTTETLVEFCGIIEIVAARKLVPFVGDTRRRSG
jgi:hypothetical protein